MAFVGNLLWFILGGGIISWLLWIMLGLLMAITIIGIPFATAAFRISGFAAFPFGKELIDCRFLDEKRIAGTSFANFLWIIFAGLWLAISHVFAGVGCCFTIIGIPFGLAHFKLAGVCFAPLGKMPVSKELGAQARCRTTSADTDIRLGK